MDGGSLCVYLSFSLYKSAFLILIINLLNDFPEKQIYGQQDNCQFFLHFINKQAKSLYFIIKTMNNCVLAPMSCSCRPWRQL